MKTNQEQIMDTKLEMIEAQAKDLLKTLIHLNKWMTEKEIEDLSPDQAFTVKSIRIFLDKIDGTFKNIE